MCFPQNIHIGYVLSDVISPRMYQLRSQKKIIISIALIQTRNSFPRNPGGISEFKRQKGDKKFHTEGPKILGAAVQNLAATAIWRPGFM